MQITRVRLQNIGPHQHFQVDFSSGLIGIVGANGAGKSTLVNSIYAALTNDFSRFSTVKADIIRNGSGNEPSFIQLEGVHRGQKFLLTRSLRPSGNEFTIGEKSYTKANEVNDAVTAELNITKSVIDKYVFVDQWQMFGFLNETASERAKTFQFLCGTEIASQIHKVCSDYVTRQQGIEIVDNSTELSAAITEAENEMAKAKQEGKEAKVWILSEEAYEENQRLYRAGLALPEAKKEEARLSKLLDEAHDKYDTLISQRNELEEKLKAHERWLNKWESTIATARAFYKSHKSHEKMESLKHETKRDLESAEKEVERLNVAAPLDQQMYISPDFRDSAAESLVHLAALIKSAKAAELDGAVCESCLQPIDDNHKQQLKAGLSANVKKHADLEAMLTYSKSYDKNEASRLRSLNVLLSDVALLKKQLEDIEKLQVAADPSEGSMSLDSARECLRKEKRLVTAVEELSRQINDLKLPIEKAHKAIAQHNAGVEAAKAIIQAAPGEAKLAHVKKELQTSKEAENRLSLAIGKYRAFKKTKAQAEETLTQLKLRLAEKSKIRNLLETISAVGDVFHWNQLPKTVSQANLELLIDDINSNLKLFNNPFVVEADSDLTFRVFLPGLLPVKAKQLSGGQKVVLAIAFRAALDRVFGHDVGMMFLDEPTAGLDADNVNFFHEALQQLAQKVGHTRQLVVITHVQELGTVFDQLIEVKKG